MDLDKRRPLPPNLTHPEYPVTLEAKRWRLHPGIRMVLQSPSSRVASDLLLLDRSVSSRVIGLITGHGHLRKHLQRVAILQEDPLSRERYAIFSSLDKGGEFPQEDLIGCFRPFASWCDSGVYKRPLRFKCMAVGRPIEEEEGCFPFVVIRMGQHPSCLDSYMCSQGPTQPEGELANCRVQQQLLQTTATTTRSQPTAASVWESIERFILVVVTVDRRISWTFVSCVCVLSPFPQYPNGLILTGGCDKKICAFHPTLFQPLFILDDHKDNVCSLSAGIQPGFVLSSSWDKSAKLWRVGEQECVLTLTGHELTIWRVLQMANGTIVTGSADKTIRVYSPDGTYLRTLTGHKDCVRDLAAESAVELLSCANDATIRKWNVDTGESLEVYFGHKHYIYSLVASAGLMVSGGEDRAVRVWTGKESEEITLPVQSVWAVARLPNGDIVTGTK
ncbi:hypothetical protein J6590_097669 [Homalodisca vitripennis]|nr:hypothetical protein J6590_097669 [Homalodisca vitripennis]